MRHAGHLDDDRLADLTFEHRFVGIPSRTQEHLADLLHLSLLRPCHGRLAPDLGHLADEGVHRLRESIADGVQDIEDGTPESAHHPRTEACLDLAQTLALLVLGQIT